MALFAGVGSTGQAAMKPRIRIRFGIRCCVTVQPCFMCGCGYSPTEAFREWQERIREGA